MGDEMEKEFNENWEELLINLWANGRMGHPLAWAQSK
jgi:hypothetical protein